MFHTYFIDEFAVGIDLFHTIIWLATRVVLWQIDFIIAKDIWDVADKDVIGLDVQMNETNFVDSLNDFYQFKAEL